MLIKKFAFFVNGTALKTSFLKKEHRTDINNLFVSLENFKILNEFKNDDKYRSLGKIYRCQNLQQFGLSYIILDQFILVYILQFMW